MEMYIQVPDDAFVLTRKTNAVKKICRICDGTGNVTIKDKGFVCPDCNGSGEQIRYFPDWAVEKGKLSSVIISAEGRLVRYVYDVPRPFLYGKDSVCKVELGAEDVYSQKGDAEAEASRRRNAEVTSSDEERGCQYA